MTGCISSPKMFGETILNPAPGSTDQFIARIGKGTNVGLRTEEFIQPEFEVFPVPVNRKVVLSFNRQADNNTAIRIVNVTGQEVVYFKVTEGLMSAQIEVGELASGVYFVTVTLANLSKTKRILVL